MEFEQRLQVLKQVANVAALAGLVGKIGEDGQSFGMSFDTAGGRGQFVYVRVTGSLPDGHTIVTVFSPARVVDKGMFSGLSKDHAIELLKLNENTFFARFGIWDMQDKSMIVASSDLILETMDPTELRAHAGYVALAADKYEAAHGGDTF